MSRYKTANSTLKTIGILIIIPIVLSPAALPIFLISDDNDGLILCVKYLSATFIAGVLFFGMSDEIKLKLGLIDEVISSYIEVPMID